MKPYAVNIAIKLVEEAGRGEPESLFEGTRRANLLREASEVRCRYPTASDALKDISDAMSLYCSQREIDEPVVSKAGQLLSKAYDMNKN